VPFLYELKLAATEPEFTFVQQLVPAGSLVGTGQPVATLTDGTMEYHLPAPRQGLLVEWFSTHGTEVQAGDVLARIVCEGDAVDVADAVPMRLG
jgi:acetyl/propionyl-CoA carboxylase alpha subunit